MSKPLRHGRTDFGHKWKYEYRYFGFYSNHIKCVNQKNGQRKRDWEYIKLKYPGAWNRYFRDETMMMAQRDEIRCLGLSWVETRKYDLPCRTLWWWCKPWRRRKPYGQAVIIDSLVANYPDCHTTGKHWLLTSLCHQRYRDLAEVEKCMKVWLLIKNAYLGRKLKTSIDNIKRYQSVAWPRISHYQLRTERMFFIWLQWEDCMFNLLDFWASPLREGQHEVQWKYMTSSMIKDLKYWACHWMIKRIIG